MIVIRRIDPPPELQPRLLEAPPAPRECEVSSNGKHTRVPPSTYTDINYPGKVTQTFCSWCGQTLPEVENETEADRYRNAIDAVRRDTNRKRSIDRIRRRSSQSSVTSKRGRDGSKGRGLFDGVDGEGVS